MSQITINQQRALLRPVLRAMLGEQGMEHIPSGDRPLHEEIEMTIFGQADATSIDLVSDMIERMTKACNEALHAEFGSVPPSPEPGDTIN